MLPLDVTRCAGFAPGTHHDTCPRRGDCARFRSRCGPQSPMAWSACEDGDSFIHAATVADDATAAHPADASPAGVLSAQPATHDRS